MRAGQNDASRQIQDLMDACKDADKRANDAKAELEQMRASEAKKRISWDEAALANDGLQSNLKEANKKLEEAVARTQNLEVQVQQGKDAVRQQMMSVEEAQNALTRVYMAISNLSARGPAGGVGISLGSAEVSVKGKRTKVIKINGLAAEGTAAATGLVQVGDTLLEVDGRDVSKVDAKAAKELVKGPAGSLVRLQIQRGNLPAAEVTIERSGATSSSDAGSAVG